MPDSLSASEYILDNFKPSDRVAVLLRNRATEEVVQRIASVKDIAAHDFQQWLTDRNRAGFDIYIGMNTLKDGACSRTKRDIHEIRHVYLDLDYRGPEALKAIQSSEDVPTPNFVLDTSPGKHQVVWKVEGGTRRKLKTSSSGWLMSSEPNRGNRRDARPPAPRPRQPKVWRGMPCARHKALRQNIHPSRL